MVGWEVVRMEEVKETSKSVQSTLNNLQGRGVIIEPTLCWIEAKRENGKTRTELCEIISEMIEANEIHVAKEALAEFVKEKRTTFMTEKKFQLAVVGRKGNHKTSSEIDDICDMLEWMDESDALPLLVMYSSHINKMPRKTNEEDQEIGERLGKMEDLSLIHI